MNRQTNLLIIGAGPFGLALAAKAKHANVDHLIVGKPMEFWRSNMPKGMLLRSACDWHLDPQNVDTIEAYLQTVNKTTEDVEPLSLEFYLSYVDWFQTRKQIDPLASFVERLNLLDESFIATMEDGNAITSRNVALAPGFKHFANIPEALRLKLPIGSYQHTCDFTDFSEARDKRFLIIGGRQSAFEWAALLLESGASQVHLAHRHASPAFDVADWSWVGPIVDSVAKDPGWFRKLSQIEKDEISKRLWSEGRLKVEPWLESRLKSDRVQMWPHTEVERCSMNNGLQIVLSNGKELEVDQIVLATGYNADIKHLPYLANGNLLEKIQTKNGFPALDEQFQTSVPRLFITSLPAVQDFGPYFGFTVAVRASAEVIVRAIN